jgi:hypothetical protein
MINQVITKFLKEIDDEQARIYREATNEDRTLRLYDIESLKYGLRKLGGFLDYPFRAIYPFTIHGQHTYSGQEPIPYSNFQSNLAELYKEAIQCHYDMISRLIVLRLTLEKGQNTIEKKNVPYIVIPKLGNNIRRTPRVSSRRTKRASKPKLPPGANIHYPKQGASLNSPNVNSPRANSNSRSRPKSKPKPRRLSVRLSGNKK